MSAPFSPVFIHGQAVKFVKLNFNLLFHVLVWVPHLERIRLKNVVKMCGKIAGISFEEPSLLFQSHQEIKCCPGWPSHLLSSGNKLLPSSCQYIVPKTKEMNLSLLSVSVCDCPPPQKNISATWLINFECMLYVLLCWFFSVFCDFLLAVKQIDPYGDNKVFFSTHAHRWILYFTDIVLQLRPWGGGCWIFSSVWKGVISNVNLVVMYTCANSVLDGVSELEGFKLSPALVELEWQGSRRWSVLINQIPRWQRFIMVWK